MPGRVWVIQERALRRMLGRAAAGEDPDAVMLEQYANAAAHEYEYGEPDDDQQE